MSHVACFNNFCLGNRISSLADGQKYIAYMVTYKAAERFSGRQLSYCDDSKRILPARPLRLNTSEWMNEWITGVFERQVVVPMEYSYTLTNKTSKDNIFLTTQTNHRRNQLMQHNKLPCTLPPSFWVEFITALLQFSFFVRHKLWRQVKDNSERFRTDFFLDLHVNSLLTLSVIHNGDL